MDRVIHIVMGTTGEYSDRTEWPVRGFYSKSNAEALVSAATARAREMAATRESHEPEGENQFDPDMRMDYTGTSYYILDVPLEDDLFMAHVEEALKQ